MNYTANVVGFVVFVMAVSFVAAWRAVKGAARDVKELWQALIV